MKVLGTCMLSFTCVSVLPTCLIVITPRVLRELSTIRGCTPYGVRLRSSGTLIGAMRVIILANLIVYLRLKDLGRLEIPNRDVWAIDGTVLVLGSTRYLVYSSWDGAGACFLYLRHVRVNGIRSVPVYFANDKCYYCGKHSQNIYATVFLGASWR